MTDAEKRLWHRVRNRQLGVKFRRQQCLGSYVVDFVCFEKKLVIEIDGGEHFESSKDEIRDKWFHPPHYPLLRQRRTGIKGGEAIVAGGN